VLTVPEAVRSVSGSLRGTRPIGASCFELAWSSDNASAGTIAPGLSRDGARNGLHPMRGSRMLVSKASSEALLMTVPFLIAASLAAVS
jgi:hypothetical protein